MVGVARPAIATPFITPPGVACATYLSGLNILL